MARAALEGDIDPDSISDCSSVEIIRSSQTGPVLAFPPEQRASRLSALIKEIGRQKVSSSRGKTKERKNFRARERRGPPRLCGTVDCPRREFTCAQTVLAPKCQQLIPDPSNTVIC